MVDGPVLTKDGKMDPDELAKWVRQAARMGLSARSRARAALCRIAPHLPRCAEQGTAGQRARQPARGGKPLPKIRPVPAQSRGTPAARHCACVRPPTRALGTPAGIGPPQRPAASCTRLPLAPPRKRAGAAVPAGMRYVARHLRRGGLLSGR